MIYIAAPFFNNEQVKRVELLEMILDSRKEEYFSPRKESNLLFNEAENKGEETFKLNCKKIEDADLIIAITNDKDTGTLWETGYAYALKKKVIFIFDGGREFNLMLANSGIGLLSFAELNQTLDNMSVVGFEVLKEKALRASKVF